MNEEVNASGVVRRAAVTREVRMVSLRGWRQVETADAVKGVVTVSSESLVIWAFRVLAEAESSNNADLPSPGDGVPSCEVLGERLGMNCSMRAIVVVIVIAPGVLLTADIGKLTG